LPLNGLPCYGHRLKPPAALDILPVSLSNRKTVFCHEHSYNVLFFACFLSSSILAPGALSQTAPLHPLRVGAPAADEISIEALSQKQDGDMIYLRGECKIETTETLVKADEIDYNRDTHWAEARGHVHFENFVNGDKLEADHGKYNLQSDEGTFYVVSGTSPPKVNARLYLLSTTNPFYFQGEWAERIKDKYIVHNGFMTDCKLPKPWWTLNAPLFDIIPDNRAIARRAVYRIKHIPVLYAPVYTRPLGRNPRKSGFLTPQIGNSSTKGFTVGLGYYWAIARNYDATYQGEYFGNGGLGQLADFRGKPTQKSDFNFTWYSVNAIGTPSPTSVFNSPGYTFEITGKAELPWGFTGRMDINYLSSFLFRQTFSQTYNEAINSQVNSVGYAQRHWTDYVLSIVFKRNQLFESTQPEDFVAIGKLPEVTFDSRDQTILNGPLPVWVSFDSSFTLARRQEPTFQTGVFDREDIYPHITTAFSFAGFRLSPSFSLRATHYGESYVPPSGATPTPGTETSTSTSGTTAIEPESVNRKALEVDLDFRMPTLERIYSVPDWLGVQMKHVIEPYATFQYVTGINNFDRIITIDLNDVFSDTNQIEIGVINRFYVKDKKGKVNERLSWAVAQRRYFDTTFGGALIPGERNVFTATEELTAFAFAATPRSYSPVVSDIKAYFAPNFSGEWRADYDPMLGRFDASIINLNAKYRNFFVNLSHNLLNGYPSQIPTANQITNTVGYGNNNRRGWNAAFSLTYDYERDVLLYNVTQVSYNTDCCGFSAQFRRFALGARNENQWTFSYQIANVSSFGSLRRQDRIF
jgi:LPS-assembly protein